MHKIKLLITLFIAFLLASCNQPVTREYLLQHPKNLQKTLSDCQNNNTSTAACEMVFQLAEEFVKIANERGSNPEAFGKQILKTQEQVASLTEKLTQAKADYKKLRAANASDNDLAKAAASIRLLEEAYRIQHEQVKLYLAVVAATDSVGL
jgi:hypothetical protein